MLIGLCVSSSSVSDTFFVTSCGCPSPKVAGHGCFGVRLMLDPKVKDICFLNNYTS